MENRREEHNRVDLTPLPVEVGPDSSRSFAVERRQAPEVRRSRGMIRKLVPAVVAGATAFMAPTAIAALHNRGVDHFHARMDQTDSEAHPESLVRAQSWAATKLYGIKGKGRGINVEGAQEAAEKAGKGKTLDVNSYVSPDLVKISPEGNYFTVEGKDYGLVRRKTETGTVLIVASRTVIEESLLGDKTYYSNKRLVVGGAKNDASSDRNGDGVTTPEEVIETADEFTRRNLQRVLTPQERRVAGNDIIR